MMKRLAALGLGIFLTSTSLARGEDVRRYVDHRSYPAGYFDTVKQGDAVQGEPGFLWFHDGQRWYQLQVPVPTAGQTSCFQPYPRHSSTYCLVNGEWELQAPPTPVKMPTVESLKRGLDWVCYGFEDDGSKISGGGNPEVVLVVEHAATSTRDRQVCLGLEKPRQ